MSLLICFFTSLFADVAKVISDSINMNFNKLKTFDRDRVHVVVESPMNSRVKYAYDPEMRVMKYEKELPEGLSFPFDFGFIPGTIGDDGDPLDILVLINTPSLSGCVMVCRL